MLLQRGEVDVEAEASGGLVGDMDFSLVHLDAVFDDRESESGAAGSPGATLVDAVEAFEEMGQVRGVYPAAIVREGETDHAVAVSAADDLDAIASAITQGIVDQVDKHRFQ